MMLKEVYINQISAYLPNEAVDNDEMEAILGQVGKKPSRARAIILKRNGIKTRHYAIDPTTRMMTHSNAELAASAIQKIFDQGIDYESITYLACGTSYADQVMPSHAAMVHGALKHAKPYEILSAAGVCAAGIAALKGAYNSIRTGEHKHVIACASELASSVMKSENFKEEIAHKLDDLVARPELAFEKDFLRWMLSDGAGAMYLSDQPNSSSCSLKIKWIDSVSFANEMPVCMYAGGDFVEGKFQGLGMYTSSEQHAQSILSVKQDVKILNENIVRYTVEKALALSIKKHGLDQNQIDYFLPHYSSLYFADKMYEGLKNINFEIPKAKWFTNLSSKGNTGSASIYIMLEEFLRTRALKNGQNILCFIPESGRFTSAFMMLEVVCGE